MTSLEQAKEIVKVMDKMKAKDIRLIDIHDLSSLGDYFVVSSAGSTTQVKAIADEIEDKLSEQDIEPNRVEGRQSAQWILMDYYNVMAHIFLDEARTFYNLERLWSDAPMVDISDLLTRD